MATDDHLRNIPANNSTTNFSKLKRISWGAIIAGTVAALGVQMLLSLLGLAIGLSTINPMEESNPFSGLGTGALIWWALSVLIALFAGGWVAGRLAGMPRTPDSILHGVLTWCLFTLLSFYLLTTTLGSIISGVGGVVGKTLSVAGEGVAAVAPEAMDKIQEEANLDNINLEEIQKEAEQLLSQTGKEELQPENLGNTAEQVGSEASEASREAAQNPQQVGEEASSLVNQIFTEGEDIVEEIDREAAVNVVMERTGKSQQEANQIVDNWINTFQQAKAQFEQTKAQAEEGARKAGEDIASAVSKASTFAFIGLLLGLVVAGVGGKVGEPHDNVVERKKVHA